VESEGVSSVHLWAAGAGSTSSEGSATRDIAQLELSYSLVACIKR
jgi:hypothetical protein